MRSNHGYFMSCINQTLSQVVRSDRSSFLRGFEVLMDIKNFHKLKDVLFFEKIKCVFEENNNTFGNKYLNVYLLKIRIFVQ